MLIKKIHGWELPENLVTPEHVFLNRQAIRCRDSGAGAAATGIGLGARAEPQPIRQSRAVSRSRSIRCSRMPGGK